MTFETYRAKEDWQREIKDTALRYCEAVGGAWFFAGGAVGCGKTHICTAIAGKLLAQHQLRYTTWPRESARLKSALMDDPEYYTERLELLTSVSVLYIDDFFKITRDSRGERQAPSPADVRLAHEILNQRDLAQLRTIISSERWIHEICDIDQAIGGRIAARASGYTLTIARTRERDYRIQLASKAI